MPKATSGSQWFQVGLGTFSWAGAYFAKRVDPMTSDIFFFTLLVIGAVCMVSAANSHYGWVGSANEWGVKLTHKVKKLDSGSGYGLRVSVKTNITFPASVGVILSGPPIRATYSMLGVTGNPTPRVVGIMRSKENEDLTGGDIHSVWVQVKTPPFTSESILNIDIFSDKPIKVLRVEHEELPGPGRVV